jgi:hypothetical protein
MVLMVRATPINTGQQHSAIGAKSLVPYRQCSAARTFRASALLVRSSADTAICAKPLAR